MKDRILAIIPARYASKRFEGKPLALINGVPMVIRVYDAVKKSGLFDKVCVATDDERIYDCVKNAEGEVLMTSPQISNGTQRCEAALKQLEQQGEKYDILVNIQGDEPLIKKQMIQSVVQGFDNKQADIVTLKKQITDYNELCDANNVKVITADDRALYFSRSVIPYDRDAKGEESVRKGIYYKHIGIYGYRTDVLKNIVNLKPSVLEQTESLEQLRWLENGYKIIVMTTEYDTCGVDTYQDLQKAEEMLNKQND